MEALDSTLAGSSRQSSGRCWGVLNFSFVSCLPLQETSIMNVKPSFLWRPRWVGHAGTYSSKGRTAGLSPYFKRPQWLRLMTRLLTRRRIKSHFERQLNKITAGVVLKQGDSSHKTQWFLKQEENYTDQWTGTGALMIYQSQSRTDPKGRTPPNALEIGTSRADQAIQPTRENDRQVQHPRTAGGGDCLSDLDPPEAKLASTLAERG